MCSECALEIWVVMKIELTVTIKNRLKALMSDAGFRSMQALANETGISRNMLYLFERGTHTLSTENLCKVIWALGCSFDDLIKYEVQSNEPEHWDDLSDDLKDTMLKEEHSYLASKKKRA